MNTETFNFNNSFSKDSVYLELQIQKVEQVSNTSFVDYSTLKVKRVNRTRKLFGNLTYHLDMDNSYKESFKFYKKSGSGYQLLPYKLIEKPFCDFNRQDEFIYPDFAAALNLPEYMPCPLAKVRKCLGF